MKRRRTAFLVLCSLLLMAVLPLRAEAESRRLHKFGIYGEYWSQSAISANAGLNLGNWGRLHAGYGSLNANNGSGTLSEVGLYFFLARGDLAPFLGVSWLNVSAKVGGFSAVGAATLGSFGFDWLTGNGFNLGVRASADLNHVDDPGFSGCLGFYF